MQTVYGMISYFMEDLDEMWNQYSSLLTTWYLIDIAKTCTKILVRIAISLFQYIKKHILVS